MQWIETQESKPNNGEWVLVWNSSRNVAIVAKWGGTHWLSVCNNTSAKHGTHWAKIVGPCGENRMASPTSNSGYTKKDSQDT